MKSQSPGNVSINSHEVTQNTSLAIQNCPSNLTTTIPICINLESTIQQDSKPFGKLLDKNETVSIQQKKIQAIVTQIFKAMLNISLETLKELFSFTVRNYNFRTHLTINRIKTNYVFFGSKSLSSLAPKMLNLV